MGPDASPFDVLYHAKARKSVHLFICLSVILEET